MTWAIVPVFGDCGFVRAYSGDEPHRRLIGDDAMTTDNNRRWLALAVICAGELMIVLDGTIVNVALRRSRRASASATPASPGQSTHTS